MSPYVYICNRCGSSRVALEAAFVRWDPVTQAFVASDLCDKGHFCDNCDDECSVSTRDLTEAEITQLADGRPLG